MRDQGIWSFSLGRWSGVYVRLHAFFLLFAVFTLYIGWLLSSNDSNTTWLSLFCVIVLLVSVLVHELGHVCTAARLGGGADEIVIGPLGGLSSVRIPHEPQSELLAITAGPLVNFAICIITAAALVFFNVRDVAALLHPLRPEGIAEGPAIISALKLTLWINWLLILVNLIPAYPFDGARALRAGIMCLWPNIDSRQVVLVVARLAKVVAFALVIVAWLYRKEVTPSELPVPTWFPMVMLAIFVFFSARVEEGRLESDDADDGFFGYDFSQGYTSLERSIDGGSPQSSTKTTEPIAGPLVRWLQNRREQKERRRIANEAEEDRRVDDILHRLHETGLDKLSLEDRRLLDRVSARLRSRSES